MPFSRVVSAVALALAVGQGTPPATPPAQAATALVAGQVVDAVTNRPVSDMVVTLTMAGAAGPTPAVGPTGRKILTDGSGRFVFSNLVAGRYSVTAVRAGYVAGALGKLVPRGPSAPLQLRDGERVADLRILVWKHAAIRGRVTDEAGEPVIGARVSVLHRTMISGRPGYTGATTTTTDDRGEYRAGLLEPGAYVVGVLATSTTLPIDTVDEYNAATGDARTALQRVLFAAAPTMTSLGSSAHQVIGDHLLQVEGRLVAPPEVSRDGNVRIYPTTFHGGTSTISEAQVVSVAAGEQRAAVDLSLRLTRGFRVSGTVAESEGPLRPTPMFLFSAAVQDPNPLQSIASTLSDASGRFTFLAVPPGQYLLRALLESAAPSGGAGNGSLRWASSPVQVADRDIGSVKLTLQAGFRVAGRIVIEDDAATLPMNRLFVTLEPADRALFGEFSESQVGPDRTFRSSEAPPGRYRVTLPGPAGWFVKSVARNGQVLEDLPFDLKESITDLVITVSHRGAKVSGTVRTATSVPDATAAVVLFPVDPRQWIDFSAYARRIKDVRASRDATFSIADLPDGEYFIVALPQQQLDWGQPRFFETLSRFATRVTLGPGEARSLDLRTVTVKW